MSELPRWPDAPANGSPESWMAHGGADYQRARAEAAMARLRLAVEHINHSAGCAWVQPFGKMRCDCGYHEALEAIGEIPEA
jgi:hypothetical protein